MWKVLVIDCVQFHMRKEEILASDLWQNSEIEHIEISVKGVIIELNRNYHRAFVDATF